MHIYTDMDIHVLQSLDMKYGPYIILDLQDHWRAEDVETLPAMGRSVCATMTTNVLVPYS